MSASRISYLDGLRGVAIIAVVLFHAFSRWGHVEPYEQAGILQVLFSMGWMGVQLFFAISGYVIYMTLLKSQNFLMFGVSRYLRLAPAMLVASVLIFVASFLIPERPQGQARLIDFLPSLTFVDPETLTALLGTQVRSLEGVFWTLYIEVKFYFLAALLFFVAKDKALHGLFIGYFGYLLATILLSLGANANSLILLKGLLEYAGFEHYGWFLLGICTFKYVSRNEPGDLFLMVAVAMVAGSHLIVSKTFSYGLPVATICMILLFLVPVFSDRLKAFLSRPTLLFFGLISYPLYLVHENTVTGLAIKLHNIGVDLPAYLYPLPFIALVVLVAYLIATSEPWLKRRITKLLPLELFGQKLVRTKA